VTDCVTSQAACMYFQGIHINSAICTLKAFGATRDEFGDVVAAPGQAAEVPLSAVDSTEIERVKSFSTTLTDTLRLRSLFLQPPALPRLPHSSVQRPEMFRKGTSAIKKNR